MKQGLLICTIAATLPTLSPADPAEDLAMAAKKLAEAKNYTWTSTTAFGERERVTSGKTGSGGFSMVSYPMRDNTIDVLMRNGKAAIKTDGGWEVADAEAEGDENRRLRFLARIAERQEAPTKQVGELVAKLEDVQATENGFSGSLSEEAARELMTWRGRGRDGGERQAPPISGASGKATFTVSDGVVTKYALTLSGTMTFNDQERDIGRTTTVAFSNVGSTSFDIPEEAAGLLAN